MSEWRCNPADQSEGYLTFVRQGALLAQPFDFSRNQLVGESRADRGACANPCMVLMHAFLWRRMAC